MRKKLIALLRSNMDILRAAGISATATLRLADHLIENGVTIPVRCKDCKYYIPFVEPYSKAGQCNRKMLGLIADNDFCSYGERKDNDCT